jgi:hypothetical protein
VSIRPIDLQTNISQIIEVGRSEQARSDAVVGQQHVLENESGEQSRLINTKLDEMKKGESAVVQDQQKKREERKNEKEAGAGEEESKRPHKKERSLDDRMGTIIDVLK